MHVIVGDDLHATIYQAYLESTGNSVIKSLTEEGPFDLGFICGNNEETSKIDVNTSIDLLAPRCKVLVTPKLNTFAEWAEKIEKYPSCQFVMAKPDLYRPQVDLLRDIRLMKDIIYDIEIFWDNIIGLIHVAHMVAGPLSAPYIDKDTMTFKNFGIEAHCKEADYNEVKVNFKDGSGTSHLFTSHNKIADHNMVQDLFGLKKFNPGEYHKHFILDRFVHILLE